MNTDGDGFRQAMAEAGKIKTRRGERRGEEEKGKERRAVIRSSRAV